MASIATERAAGPSVSQQIMDRPDRTGWTLFWRLVLGGYPSASSLGAGNFCWSKPVREDGDPSFGADKERTDQSTARAPAGMRYGGGDCHWDWGGRGGQLGGGWWEGRRYWGWEGKRPEEERWETGRGGSRGSLVDSGQQRSSDGSRSGSSRSSNKKKSCWYLSWGDQSEWFARGRGLQHGHF
jgi:hypothetical protein